MRDPEVIVVSSKNCTIFDASSHSTLATFKLGGHARIAPKSVALLSEDYVVAAVDNSAFLHAWKISKSVNKDEIGRFPVSGRVTCLIATSCGRYCIAAVCERFIIWKIQTGEAVGSLSRHYMDISSMCLTSDNSQLITGGKDGHVFVWNLWDIVQVNKQSDQHEPHFHWKHHCAEVTDIYIGIMGLDSRAATSSVDCTCRLYEMDSGSLLATIVAEVQLSSVVMDYLESYILLGGETGCIYKACTDMLPMEFVLSEDNCSVLKAHSQKVLFLSVSDGSKKVLSASLDNTVKVWDMLNMTLITQLRVDGGEIGNAFFATTPRCFFNEKLRPDLQMVRFKNRCGPDLDEDGRQMNAVEPIRFGPKMDLTLAYVGALDNCYQSDILDGAVALPVQEKGLPTNYEDMFQATLNSKTVNELHTINSQMYAYSMRSAIDSLSGYVYE